MIAVNEAVDAKSIPGSDSSKVSVFPNWNISADNILVENSDVRYDNKEAIRRTEGIDFNHLEIKKLHGDLNDIEISKAGIRAVIKSANFQEECGLSLKKLEAEVQFMNTATIMRNLQFASTSSEISGNVNLEYSSLEKLVKDIANCNLNIEIKKIKLGRDDILLFVPDLTRNPLFQNHDSSFLITSAVVSGKVSDLNIDNLELSLFKENRFENPWQGSRHPRLQKNRI